MRVVTPRRLTEFAKKHPAAKMPLLYWYEIVRHAVWNRLAEVRADFRTVDYVGNHRYVFNIKGSDYRLIAIIIFPSQKLYIRFIGTHKEYDRIDAKTI
jgi:mRNA interferase HigB